MKKFFLSLIAVATLFSACSSDDINDAPAEKGTGTLKAMLTFSKDGLKATPSGSVPTTSWGNINQMHVILYYKGSPNDGKVAYSSVLSATDIANKIGDTKTFTWTAIPAGTYRLAIVANTGAGASIQGKKGATDIIWEPNSLINQKFGSAVATDLYLDFKKITTSPAFPAPYNTKGVAAGNIAYAVPSEVFTVYDDNVVIIEGAIEQVGDVTPLQLKREVALFRTRLNVSASFLTHATEGVDFGNANNFMLVQTLPVGLGLKTDSYAGGVFNTSNNTKVLVAKTGATAFSNAAPLPATHSNPAQILTGGFTRWNEFPIFPNGAAGDATVGRKYNIVISAFAEAGYQTEDGPVPAGGANIYWDGVINQTFEPNIIREVDITITTRGTLEPPVTPTPVGRLDITVGAPIPWDGNIKTTEIDI